jgi:hypothetical protein
VTSVLTTPAGLVAAAPPARPQLVRYRYHFTDFMSGALRATLPMTGVSLEDVLGGVGQASGSLNLSDPTVRAQDVASATIPRRSCLWAERMVVDEQRRLLSATVQWGGIIMSRVRSRTSRALTVKAVSWEGYLASRLVRDATWVQRDKADILQWLLYAGLGGDILAGSQFDPENPWLWGSRHTAPCWNVPGVVLGSVPDAGYLTGTPLIATSVRADRTYLATDLKTILAAAQSLATTGQGYDWRLEPFRDPGTGQLAVRPLMGGPRLGRTRPPSVVWSSDRNTTRAGQLLDYTITEDGSATYNMVTALGSGQPPDQLRARATNFAEGTYGYPPYETGASLSSTDDLVTQAALDAHATGILNAGIASEVQVSGVKVRGDLFPTLDTYTVADDATLLIGDSLTGRRLTAVGQITGRKITPPEQGASETVALDLVGAVS